MFSLPSLPKAVNPDDLRLGDVIYELSEDFNVGKLPELAKILNESSSHRGRPNIFLLGFPHDEGTARNGGRVGGKDGPNVVFNLMKRVGTIVNPEKSMDLSTVNIFQWSSCVPPPPLSLSSAHSALIEAIQALLNNIPHCIPIIVGGSNDQSYPNAKSLLNHYGHLNVVNIDAHLDVRPLKDGLPHSGSPFRLLLEDEQFVSSQSKFAEFACQGQQCADAHAKFVTQRGFHLHWLTTMRKNDVAIPKQFTSMMENYLQSYESKLHTFVSFDVDSIRSSDCPGVSAPSPIGLTAEEAIEIAFEAGKNPHVVAIDFSEFNPKVEDYRTGKLIANLIYFFIGGIASRRGGGFDEQKN